MELKEVVKLAKTYAFDAFSDENLKRVTLEEIEFSEQSKEWLITLGLYRPSVTSFGIDLSSVTGELEYKRAYKVFRISDDTGQVTSVKNREISDE